MTNHAHDCGCGCSCGHHPDEDLPNVEGHNGFEIEFKAHYKVERQKVWRGLTDSDQIKKWFPELAVTEVKEGGEIGYQEEGEMLSFLILDVEPPYLLSYQWKQMIVGFELEDVKGQTELIFKEWIEEVSDEIIADLTEWAVRLEALRYYLEEGHVPSLDDFYDETYSEIKAIF